MAATFSLESLTSAFLSKCTVAPNADPVVVKGEGFSRLLQMFEMKLYDELLLLIEQIVRDGTSSMTKEPHFDAAVKLLVAEVRLRSGHQHEAFAQMLALKASPDYQQSKPWQWRIDCSIINAAVRLRLWDLAVSELLQIHDLLTDKASHYSGEILGNVIKADIVVLNRICRVLMQTGDMVAATKYSSLVARLAEQHGHLLDQAGTNHARHLHALTLFAKEEFEHAMSIFQEILLRAGQPAGTPGFLLFDLDAGDIDLYECLCQLDDPVFPSAANNYAVCAMHLGRVDEAVQMLEGVIRANPAVHLIDPIVFNLCTMYDISHAAPVAELKKRALKNVADAYWVGETALNWKSFRLSSS